jgi:hypothetical protein
MATWKLSNYHKKNVVETQHWSKDGKSFTRSEGFRWGKFTREDDEQPDVDLENPDGYEPLWDDWEMDMLDDGCWAEFDFPEDFTQEEREEIERLWDEDSYSGLEGAGWYNDETDITLQGPLLLENTDTGESWNGDNE